MNTALYTTTDSLSVGSGFRIHKRMKEKMFEDHQLICFIVLVVVLLAILFTVIAIYLKRESDEILSSGQLTSNLFSPPEDLIGTESMSGGELKRVNKKVQILTQKDFINLRLSDFWILDKYDGVNREYKDDNYECFFFTHIR